MSILNENLKKLIDEDKINNVQLDTYRRKLERYGFENIDTTESLFHIDSENVATILFQPDGVETSDLFRLKYACFYAYQLIRDFGLNPEEMFALVKDSSESFFQEHGGNRELKLILDKKYRTHGKSIQKLLLNETYLFDQNDRIIIEIILRKNNEQKQFISKVIEHYNKNDLKLNDYIKSIIHININRIFKTKQRTFELLTFYLLNKSFISLIQRNKI